MQAIRVVEFHLPIPLALAVMSTLAPLLNLVAQPSAQLCLRNYSGDYKSNAVKVFNVTPYVSWLTVVGISRSWIVGIRYRYWDFGS